MRHQVVLLATGLNREKKRKLDQLALILHTKCLDEFSNEGIYRFPIMFIEIYESSNNTVQSKWECVCFSWIVLNYFIYFFCSYSSSCPNK